MVKRSLRVRPGVEVIPGRRLAGAGSATCFGILIVKWTDGAHRSKWANDLQGNLPPVLPKNPEGAVWGNIVWARSTSRDLVNWTPQKVAIYPSQPSDINGAWSGSATILRNGTPTILYTGINSLNQQVQNLAMPKNPSDPYLLEWKKSSKNPVMSPNPENQIDPGSFRDPSTAWLGADGRWKVIIGSKNDIKGFAILYSSEDFVHWIKANDPLHSATDTGMRACVDFFPVSVNSTVGVDLPTFGPDVNAKNRRLLWAWLNESSSVSDDIKKGWAGIQAVPRAVWLDKSGKQLVQWPIKEIEMLRMNPVHLPSQDLKEGYALEVPSVTAAQASHYGSEIGFLLIVINQIILHPLIDVEITFKVSDFGNVEMLDPSWTKPQLLCNQKGTSVRGSLEIDRSVVERLGGQGKSCISARVYPTLAINEAAHLYAFNNGSESVTITRLSAWSMKKARIN
ncbi:hypothetical protein GH714_036109 [Hevea brasiliensis]|uniref:Glycosyl hydrolase family 32 N-terminal domain-containing protein n=1 Tax=Hevea brasiliensis TaxID=3981 RepID=A0A6A6NEJ4_HEVBR|nr:hypothetical protein GH714_036109 [Hevea brasiliensis]